jgi:hypothetical protein
LTLLIVPIVVSFASELVKPLAAYLGEQLVPQRRDPLQDIGTLITSSVVDPKDLGNLRLVASDNVRVRNRPKKNAAIIGTLQSGDLVAVVRKHGRYRLVTFVDPVSARPSFGWAPSKNLRNLEAK